MRCLRLFALILGLIMICSMTGCKAEVQVVRADAARQLEPPTDDVSALVASNTAFAFDLYHELAREQDGNLIFSPYSISMAFAMLYAGARGETAAQMAQTLHFDLPPEQLHPAFAALDLTLQPPAQMQPTPSPRGELMLSIANSVWGQSGFAFEQPYLDALALNYGAGINTVDFSADPQAAREAIRQWIDNATGGHITDVPPSGAVSPATRLALVNAIYFKGEWSYPFTASATHDAAFHLLNGNEVSVSMMVDDAAFLECVRGDDYYAIQLNYGTAERAAMLIVLPDEGSFEDFEAGLDARLFRSLLSGLQTTNTMTFMMPRFEFDAEVDLRQTLASIGLTAPFGEGADFTGISSGGLLVDYAAHKATISVDEQGTEATSTTGVMMAIAGVLSLCGNQVTADHPFIFLIYDRPTDAILFMGRVMNPAA